MKPSHFAGQLLRTPLLPPLMLFLLSGLLGVWAAYEPAAALRRFMLLLGGILLFFLLAAGAVMRPELIRTYGWLLALGGAVLAAWSLRNGRAGHYESLFLPAVPFATLTLYDTLVRRRWPLVVLAAALVALPLLALLAGGSRAALPALAGGSLLVLGYAALARFTSPLRLGLAAAGVVLLLAFALVSLATAVPPAWWDFAAGVSNRMTLYRNSLVLAQDYLFTGGGLAGFGMLYASYAQLMHVEFSATAHNLYLNVLVAQGLFGLLALLWLGAAFLLAFQRRAAAGELRPALVAAAVALAAVFIFGLAEDTLYAGDGLLLFFVPLAFAYPYPRPAAPPEYSRLWLVPAGLALLLGALLFWQPILAAFYSNLAAVQQARLELSSYRWPEWPVQDALRRELDLRPVVAGYERALAYDAGNLSALRRLGMIFLSQGAYEPAVRHLEAAYALAPWDNATRQLAGEALIVTGRFEEGAALWRTVDHSQGQLALRAAWYKYIGDSERLARVQQAAGLFERGRTP